MPPVLHRLVALAVRVLFGRFLLGEMAFVVLLEPSSSGRDHERAAACLPRPLFSYVQYRLHHIDSGPWRGSASRCLQFDDHYGRYDQSARLGTKLGWSLGGTCHGQSFRRIHRPYSIRPLGLILLEPAFKLFGVMLTSSLNSLLLSDGTEALGDMAYLITVSLSLTMTGVARNHATIRDAEMLSVTRISLQFSRGVGAGHEVSLAGDMMISQDPLGRAECPVLLC